MPNEISGIPISALSYGEWVEYGCLESTELKKIFIKPKLTSGAPHVFEKCPNLEKVIFIDVERWEHFNATNAIGSGQYNHAAAYVTSWNYKLRYEKEPSLVVWFPDKMNIYYANVSYRYNYEEAPNEGYYWIDDYQYGEKIEYIPEDPVRTGYIFDGWYQEPDCVTQWDFETDTLPSPILNEYGNEEYQETILYAKWTLI